jgi:hypothetical protein
MAAKTLILERWSGSFGRAHDCWHLISQPDGTFSVEHAWSHPNVTADGTADAGMEVISAGWFLASVKDDELVRALRRAITAVVTGEIAEKFSALDSTLQRRREFDPLATVVEWLATCRARDLDRLLTFYDPAATLDCACTGQKLCAGIGELRDYWQKRLADPSPSIFMLQDVWPAAEAAVLDYISHDGRLVRSFFYFADNGLVKHTRCGPIELAKAG